MKLRSNMILLLTAVSAGIVVWLYAIATRDRSRESAAEWQTTIADLRLWGAQRHIRAARYDHYRLVAQDEELPYAARLFHALALSERISEGNCAAAIVRLGGEYTPPAKILVVRGTTAENLNRAIAEKAELLNEERAAVIQRAMTSGNRYAARMMIRAAATDRIHLYLLQQATARGDDPQVYTVCPTCGNCYIMAESDVVCPHCHTSQREFVEVIDN